LIHSQDSLSDDIHCKPNGNCIKEKRISRLCVPPQGLTIDESLLNYSRHKIHKVFVTEHLLNVARHGFHSTSGMSNKLGPPANGLNSLGNKSGFLADILGFVCVTVVAVVGDATAKNNGLSGHISR
jgi:hypothetical protein